MLRLISKLFVCPLIDKYGVSVYHARQKFADMERFFPLGKCATVGPGLQVAYEKQG